LCPCTIEVNRDPGLHYQPKEDASHAGGQDNPTLRYSKELPNGSWKFIGVGAEAVPSEDRPWQEQQRELYAELSQQLKALLTGANSGPPGDPRGRLG
jgi:hypothetical protein